MVQRVERWEGSEAVARSGAQLWLPTLVGSGSSGKRGRRVVGATTRRQHAVERDARRPVGATADPGEAGMRATDRETAAVGPEAATANASRRGVGTPPEGRVIGPGVPGRRVSTGLPRAQGPSGPARASVVRGGAARAVPGAVSGRRPGRAAPPPDGRLVPMEQMRILLRNRHLLARSERAWVGRIARTARAHGARDLSDRQRAVICDIYDRFRGRLGR